jgi:2-oxoglutarate ferredoxin oxidoreductase subunit alpha
MEGNEAIGWGAVAAGCNFFAGYPITPATTIYNTMLKLLPPAGGVCLQGEDEIASIGFCLGAAMAGMKTMTATSGPGISLYSEQISFAIGSEIPLVIVDVQRLGPSTGSATKGADGDVQFLRWGNSGGLPVIVLAPVDVKDCYTLTVQAFNLAERYRCPVFVAANKEISMTRETLDLEGLELPDIAERRAADAAPDADAAFLPFGVSEGQLVPDFLPIGGERLVRQTSSTHGADGYITTDPEEIAAMQARLEAKLTRSVSEFSYFDEYLVPGADTLVIAYGVTARAAKVALRRLEERGTSASLLVLKTLWPVPEALIREKAAPHKRVVMAEMNLGQYVRELQRLLPGKPVAFLGQMNGELIKPGQIMEVIANG